MRDATLRGHALHFLAVLTHRTPAEVRADIRTRPQGLAAVTLPQAVEVLRSLVEPIEHEAREARARVAVLRRALLDVVTVAQARARHARGE